MQTQGTTGVHNFFRDSILGSGILKVKSVDIRPGASFWQIIKSEKELDPINRLDHLKSLFVQAV